MAPTEFETALETLQHLFAQCRDGGGRVVLVEGGLASGKTHLLHEFSRSAQESGATLLFATGSRAEHEMQMGVIEQLFRNIDPADTPSTRSPGPPRPGGRPWEDLCEGTWTNPQALATKVHKLCGALLTLARDRPIVVAVDDIQFCDVASLRFLLSLQRRLAASRMLLVLTEWARAQSTLPEFHAELTRHPHHRLRLVPLCPTSIGHLIEATLDCPNPAQAADTYHGLTGGNPLLVRALIEDQHARGGDPDGETRAEPVPGVAYTQAVLSCLHRWEPQLLDVARAIAVLGHCANPQLISQLLEARQAVVDDAIAVMTDAGLLAGSRFRHPAAQSAVLEGLHSADRTAIHLGAAALLYRRGASSCDVAGHLLVAGQVEDRWAKNVLRDAAAQALAADDTAVALRCLELALHSSTDRHDRIGIIMVLVRTLWRVNPAATAPYLPELRVAVLEGDLAGRDAATVVRYLLWNGDIEGAAKAVAALTGTPELIDPQSAAELAIAHHWFFGADRGRLSELRFDGPAGVDPWVNATNRLATLWTRSSADAAATSAQHILENCRLEDTTVEVVAMSVYALMGGGKLDLAAFWCEQLTREARKHNEVTWQAVLGALGAAIALHRGDATSATERARAALEMLPAQGWGVLIGLPKAILLLAHTAMGDNDASIDLLPLPYYTLNTVFSLHYLRARGHYYLGVGRPLAASRDFQLCGKLLHEWGVDIPKLIPWRTDLAQANLELGHTSEARYLAEQQLERAKVVDTRTRGISLRVLAATSELADRPALLRRAVAYLQAAGDRLELARAQSDFSGVWQQLGEYELAGVLARQAAQATEAASPASRPVQRRPPAGCPEPPAERGADEQSHPVLTGAELRVAELAALGHTNREISRTLYITVSTVEQHLTRAYRKLGGKRAELRVELMTTMSRAALRPPATCQ